MEAQTLFQTGNAQVDRQASTMASGRFNMSSYETLRKLLTRGFNLDNLREFIRAAYDLARSTNVSNPAVPFVIASVLEGVARRWFEGQPITNETAEALEIRLRQPLSLLLDAVEGPAHPEHIVQQLDTLVRAYARCVAQIE